MDEIDAALDFKNVSIVANYIKERTKNAQFIIIRQVPPTEASDLTFIVHACCLEKCGSVTYECYSGVRVDCLNDISSSDELYFIFAHVVRRMTRNAPSYALLECL